MPENTDYSAPSTDASVNQIGQTLGKLTDVKNSQADQVARLSENTAKVQDLVQLLEQF